MSYEQQSFWATARSDITLERCEDDATLWCTRVENRLGDSFEEISLVTGSDGALIQRKRFSQGSDSRRKEWIYSAGEIRRRRLEPERNSWRLTSDLRLDVPASVTRPTDSLLLLHLASLEKMTAVYVHTDLNFYRVNIRRIGRDSLSIDAALGLAGPLEREVDLVALSAQVVGEPRDKPDFALLGLEGDLIIAFDTVTGVPLQIRGQAPRLGGVSIDLKSVTLRTAAP
ncbi:MAG: hypothetical protein V2J89_10600 [Halieaceae bacterium]|nr:hypothetical protein [Halieaceae bacterium]